ncbi:MAG: tRNA 2-thiouridine(34) synthase MnmA, partial [Candidatus Thioglobus sp.]
MKIMLGLSGGVDSSVAALMLIEQGFEVEALFMKNWDEDDNDGHCSAEQDLSDAQKIADKLNIKLHTVNFSPAYWDDVFSHFLQEHKKGRTPNPDVLCNKKIKFKAFLEYALDLGADKIATGHYATFKPKNQEEVSLVGIYKK